MKLTKFVHSCLLVETPDFNALIDPGSFTYDSHLINLDHLPKLDYIILTHEHADHYHEPLLRSLCKKFPHASIVTNSDLSEKTAKLKLRNPIQTGSDDNIVVFEAKHQPLPMNMPEVLNIGVHIGGNLTHSGDSYDLKSTKDFLALPITAPFASFREALDAIIKLKPKAVLPMHDWEWHKTAREQRYNWAKGLLEPHGIKFIELENTEPKQL